MGNIFFAVSTLLVAVPTGIKFFNWLATMYGGQIRFASPMLFCLRLSVQFLIGGLTGIMLAAAPFDWQLTDTYFVVGHFHWVLIGGTLFGMFAAIYYWYPEGDRPDARASGSASWHFWLLYIGFHPHVRSDARRRACSACRGASTPTKRGTAGRFGIRFRRSAR